MTLGLALIVFDSFDGFGGHRSQGVQSSLILIGGIEWAGGHLM